LYDTVIEYSSANATCVVKIGSAIDVASAPAFARYLEEAAALCERLIVSLEACPYIDSTGLAPLARLANRPSNSFAVVIPPGGYVQRIFQLSGLAFRLQVFATLDEALAARSANISV